MDEDLKAIAREIEERKIKEQEAQIVVAEQRQEMVVKNVTEATDFTRTLDDAKINTVKNAAATDEQFVKEFTEQVKQSALTSAQVEQEKQALEKQNVQFAQELLETQQKKNAKEQQISEWDKKQKRRQYHYDGVKPIMEFVGIKTPMNLPILYFLTTVLMPFYLLAKLFKGTIGALIAGAEDADRPKAVKGFMWTLLAILALSAITLGILAVLKWLGYDIQI
jgi:hypothetical protein